MKLQIALTSARGRSTTLTAERLVNAFAEKAPEGSEAPAITHGVPGMVTHATAGSGGCRGLLAIAGMLYAVIGQELFWIDAGGNASASLGEVPGTALVSMATDGDIIVIVTNPDAYTYTISTATFEQVTDAAYGGAHSVIWMNKTFVFASETEHFVGAVGGLLPFDPLLAASAEYSPDGIVGIARDHNEVLFLGSGTLESWQFVNVAEATDYPLEAISGATGEKGLAGRNAITQLDNTTVWLDQNGIVRRLAGGYVPQRISTEAIEHQLASADLASADPRVAGLQLGLGDLFEPLGIARRDPSAVRQAMFAVRMAAGEAGVFAYDAAFAHITDEDGYVTEARQARDLGFVGKSCIHPRQIALANAVFQPTPDEIAHAQRVVQTARDAQARSVGAWVVDGKMIDAPFVQRAQSVIALAARLGLLSPDRP